MKVSTILDHIDSGHIALPEFQRGYVWNRDQVRGLFDSMYKRHPVGGLLVWATEARTSDGEVAAHRGEGPVGTGVIKLLLDGQQRMTSLYGVARGRPPKFFDGNSSAFTGLRFHLGTEEFAFYQPIKMRDDPLWIDVTELMQGGTAGLGAFIGRLSQLPEHAPNVGEYVGRLSRVLAILDTDLHIEEVTGQDKTLDVVVDIFNRVNSGGTKLSKGDLALAKICADWPDARVQMKEALQRWESAGYNFNLDWLLRCVNTTLTGEAKFLYLHEKHAAEVENGLNRATKSIDQCLNLISGRLGLDHDRVLFGRYAIPVIVYYLDQHGTSLSAEDRDRLLFWFLQVGMWGRYSGSTETMIDQDLAALDASGGVNGLLDVLRLWHGSLRVEPAHFTGWSLGARFYPVLYLLTRVGGAQDWGTGLPLKSGLLGKMNHLEVHHIFPKAQLNRRNFKKAEVNAVANYCFLTKDTNLKISDRLPEEYFPEIEAKHPGALRSQWIPDDPELWRVENFREFLEARKRLLADATNRFLEELLHGDSRWLEAGAAAEPAAEVRAVGAIESLEEDEALRGVNAWVTQLGLAPGQLAFEIVDATNGEQQAVLDLAWPEGVQEGLTEPVALLLDEGEEVLALASSHGFRCFVEIEAFREYVTKEVLAEEAA